MLLPTTRILKSLRATPTPEVLEPESERLFSKDKRFDPPMYIVIFMETFVWIWALCVVSDRVDIDSLWFNGIKPRSLWDVFLFSLPLGQLTLQNAAAGHELLHKREWYKKLIGTWAYQKFWYSHFLQGHVHLHHKDVGLLRDPVTARMGESFYSYWPRSVFGQHLEVWEAEFVRIRKVFGKDVPKYKLVLYNKMTCYYAMNLSILLITYRFLGIYSVMYQFVYSFWGTTFQTLNGYLDHYGLLREKDENGVYEPVSTLHSWNFDGAYLSFNKHLHSDHHMQSYRPW